MIETNSISNEILICETLNNCNSFLETHLKCKYYLNKNHNKHISNFYANEHTKALKNYRISSDQKCLPFSYL